MLLKNIVLTVIELAVIFRVFFVLLSRDCWQIHFHVPLICLCILGFFIFPALSRELKVGFLFFVARCIARLMHACGLFACTCIRIRS